MYFVKKRIEKKKKTILNNKLCMAIAATSTTTMAMLQTQKRVSFDSSMYIIYFFVLSFCSHTHTTQYTN